MKYRNTFTAASVLALLIASAGAGHAADLNLPGSLKDPFTGAVSPNSWAGFYGQFHLGYGWDGGTNLNSATADGQQVLTPADGVNDKTSPSGGFAGIEAGYLFPIGPFIAGPAFEINIANISDTSRITMAGAPTSLGSRDSTIDWFGTGKIIIGMPVGNLFAYGLGGFAVGGVSDQLNALGVINLSDDDTKWGWVAGGGVAMKMSANWSVKLEYEHIDLGSDTPSGVVNFGGGTNSVATNKADNAFDTIRIGFVHPFN